MPRLIRPATRDYLGWGFDSRRWDHWQPRADDILIATYPKCGTTWMQRLVGMLVFQSAEPRSIHATSPWIDARFRDPVEAVIARLEAQTHRRFIKSHLPLDGLPLYEGVKIIHVARDGRDACASFHQHSLAYTAAALARFDEIGLEDARIGRAFPRPAPDLRSFYQDWVSRGPGVTSHDFFAFETGYWAERARPELLLAHYNDLTADLAGEVRRIAAFLGIGLSDALLAEIVAAGGFEAMRRDGDQLLPNSGATFEGGAARFLHKGTNGRWRDVLDADDLAIYDARVAATFTPDCARWVAGGRLVAGDPRA